MVTLTVLYLRQLSFVGQLSHLESHHHISLMLCYVYIRSLNDTGLIEEDIQSILLGNSIEYFNLLQLTEYIFIIKTRIFKFKLNKNISFWLIKQLYQSHYKSIAICILLKFILLYQVNKKALKHDT